MSNKKVCSGFLHFGPHFPVIPPQTSEPKQAKTGHESASIVRIDASTSRIGLPRAIGSGRLSLSRISVSGSMPERVEHRRGQIFGPRLAHGRVGAELVAARRRRSPSSRRRRRAARSSTAASGRGRRLLIRGVRPNSPTQTTSVVVEQAALVQVVEQRRQRLVGHRQQFVEDRVIGCRR